MRAFRLLGDAARSFFFLALAPLFLFTAALFGFVPDTLFFLVPPRFVVGAKRYAGTSMSPARLLYLILLKSITPRLRAA